MGQVSLLLCPKSGNVLLSKMPGGKPVWHGSLEGKDLDSLFGFIEAYVVCPKTIKRPFLPYRDEKNTLTNRGLCWSLL